MKKFFGVIVAIAMCVCMLLPTAIAADSILGDIDLGGLTNEDLGAIFNEMGIPNIDVDKLLTDIENGDKDALSMLNDALAKLEGKDDTTAATDPTIGSGSVDLGAVEDATGGNTGAITDMLGGLTGGDVSSLMGMISGAFGDAGIDLGGFDLGSFDVANIISSLGSSSGAAGGDTASGATDMVSGLVDTLLGGLEALGLDTSMIEGLLDNDIVNFFANMYIGYVGEVEETTTAAPETTKKPAVVTTETPKTGDTSAVFAAIATISVASAAAFVCLKKKEN